MRSFWFIAFGCLFVLLYLYQAGPFKHPKIMVLCVAALTLIDLFAVNRRYVNTESFNEPLEAQQFVATPADQAILKDTSYYRVLDWSDFQGPRSSYFHKTIGGYHAAKLTRYNDLLTHQIARQQGPNMAVIDMLNGKYFILPEGKYEQNPGAMGNAWFVDRVNYVDGAQAEMNGLDSLDVATTAVADKRFGKVLGNSHPRTPGDTIALAYYSPDKLSYNASSARGGVAKSTSQTAGRPPSTASPPRLAASTTCCAPSTCQPASTTSSSCSPPRPWRPPMPSPSPQWCSSTSSVPVPSPSSSSASCVVARRRADEPPHPHRTTRTANKPRYGGPEPRVSALTFLP